MRLLCDQHVARKYIQAFDQADGITVTTVAEELSPDASDTEIAVFAEESGWVVFTNDDDFFEQTASFGLLVYSQIEDPRPSVLVDAVTVIGQAYESHSEILETVPGNWA